MNARMLLIMLLLAGAALFTSNPLMSLLGLVFLPVLYRLFWRDKQPAIIYWGLLFQWIQVNCLLIYADITGSDYAKLYKFNEKIEIAYVLAMVSLFALSFGIWLAIRKLRLPDLTPWQQKLDPKKCLNLYVMFYLFITAVVYLFYNTGLRVLVDSFIKLQWGILYLPIVACFFSRKHNKYLILIITTQFILSFIGIFAAFKNLLLYPFIFLVSMKQKKYELKTKITICILAFVTVNTVLIWTAIKIDYREYVAAGATGQAFNVSSLAALKKIKELAIDSVNSGSYKSAFYTFTERLDSLKFLSPVIGNVPKNIPHEGGVIAWRAVTHLITPRILFPNKPIFHESDHTNKYTGKYIADSKTTAMSIGYTGDLYIDFGYFAPVAIFGLGLAFGTAYRYIFTLVRNPVMKLVVTIPLFGILYLNEISLVTFVSQYFVYILVVALGGKTLIAIIEKRATQTESSDRTNRSLHRNAFMRIRKTSA